MRNATTLTKLAWRSQEHAGPHRHFTITKEAWILNALSERFSVLLAKKVCMPIFRKKTHQYFLILIYRIRNVGLHSQIKNGERWCSEGVVLYKINKFNYHPERNYYTRILCLLIGWLDLRSS